ncbi:MAG: hypothetical protein WCJ29_00830 [bacterium]
MESSNLEKEYFEKSRETLRYGIMELSRTLDEILNRDHELPTAIIFPETTSRPLRYAIEPIIEHVYRKAGQAKPKEYFFKTFSAHHEDDDFRELAKTTSAEFSKYEAERNKLEAIRKQELKRVSSLNLDKNASKRHSDNLQDLQESINVLTTKIGKMRNEWSELEKIGATGKIHNERMKEILQRTKTGSLLIVDDVFIRGRTFNTIRSSLIDNAAEKRANYFAFLGTAHTFDESYLSPDQLSIGVLLGEPKHHMDRVGKKIPWKDYSEAWLMMQNLGFPFRYNKEASTGVIKNQASTSRYVEISKEADPKKMREVREQYRKLGETAAAKLK